MVRQSSRVILKPKSDQYWSSMRTTLAKQAGHFPVTFLPGEIGEYGDVSPWGYGANILFRCKDHQVVYAHESILTRCSTFIKDLLIASDARNNKDPFGRTMVVLPDIKSDILKQSLRILYVGEETFSFTKTPWDTVQAIIDVFERIFKIKWNLSEVDEESIKAKGNNNKSKKRKNESALDRDRKGKHTKKGQVEEDNESITSLYTEARKNALKLQSFITNNTTDDECESPKEGQKHQGEINSSASSVNSSDDNLIDTKKDKIISNDKTIEANKDVLIREKNEHGKQQGCGFQSEDRARGGDISNKEEKVNVDTKSNNSVEQGGTRNTFINNTGETNSNKKLKQTKINELFGEGNKPSKACGVSVVTDDQTTIIKDKMQATDYNSTLNNMESYQISLNQNKTAKSTDEHELDSKVSTVASLTDGSQLPVDTNSHLENAPSANRSMSSNEMHMKSFNGISEKGNNGETIERSSLRHSTKPKSKDVSILRNYSPELHKNILVLQCYKCEFSTNVDQTFKLHMDEMHKTNANDIGISSLIQSKTGDIMESSNTNLKDHLLSEPWNFSSTAMNSSEVLSSFTIVLGLLTEGILNGVEKKLNPSRTTKEVQNCIPANNNQTESSTKSTMKGSVQSCHMCAFQCKLRMQLSKHMKTAHQYPSPTTLLNKSYIPA